MSRQRQGSGDYEFSRAWYDEQRDNEIQYRVEWEVCWKTSFQRGVWEVKFTAISLYDDDGPRPIASYSAHWPNSTATTLPAFLYASAHRLARMVEQFRLDEQKHAALRVVGGERHDRG